MKPSATSVPRNILQCELPCVHKQLVLNSPLKEDIIFTKLLVVLWNIYIYLGISEAAISLQRLSETGHF